MRKRNGMIWAAAVAVAAWAMPAAAQYYGGQGYNGYDGYGGRIVRCESNDGRVRECATGGGRVVLERQHSQSPCIEGRSWGYARGGVWVAQGCRADFRVVDGGYGDDRYGNQYGNQGYGYGAGYGNTVRCESNDGRLRRCSLNGQGRAEQVRQVSRNRGKTTAVHRQDDAKRRHEQRHIAQMP